MTLVDEKSALEEMEKEASKPRSIAEASQDNNEKPPEDHVMSGAKLHTLIFGLAVAVFLMALDMSILVTGTESRLHRPSRQFAYYVKTFSHPLHH